MEPSDLIHPPATLPLMDLNSGDNLNYTTFPQDDDVSYMPTNEGPPGSALVLNNDTSNASFPGATAAMGSSSQRQRMERRGHTKSRRGCYNCKRRRIKCQENRPACGHCVKTGLKCEYPTAPLVVHQPSNQVPIFSLQDMRFFQHFLMTCFPHHPLGNESIWTHEIPCLSQNYEYLMHAILGLAASDLMTQDPSLAQFAMAHRLKAIKAIKKTLGEAPRTDTFEEGNALLATCFALLFQSVVLEDGLGEYMTFCRGVVIITMQMYCKGSRFLFSNLQHIDSSEMLRPHMEALPPVRKDWVDMAVAAIRALEPLCSSATETEYHKLLLNVAEALYSNPFLAYQSLSKHYAWWMQIPHEQFQGLINPDNPTCTLLASHWIALKQILAPVTETEFRVRAQKPSVSRGETDDMDPSTIRWLRYLNRQVDDSHRQYNAWPVWVEEQLNRDMRVFGRALKMGLWN